MLFMNDFIQEQISAMHASITPEERSKIELINAVISKLQKIQSQMSRTPSAQETLLLNAFREYLQKRMTKEQISQIINLSQEKLTTDSRAWSKKLQAQKARLSISTTTLNKHEHISEILAFIGLVLVGCSLGVGMAFASLILAELTVALIFVALLPLALVSSSMFSGLYYLFTKDTLKKEKQNINEITQTIDHLHNEQICRGKIQRLIQDIQSCCTALDSLPSIEASQSTSNSVQAGKEHRQRSCSPFFNSQSINSNRSDSAENHQVSSPLRE